MATENQELAEAIEEEFSLFQLPDVLDLFLGEKPMYHAKIRQPESHIGIFLRNGAEVVVKDSEHFSELYSVYAGFDREKLEEVADNKNDGQYLGYPSCCVEYFNNKNGANRILDRITELEQYPFHVNDISRKIKLLAHFPCRYDCMDSEKLATRKLKLIDQYLPHLVDEYVDGMRKVYIYHSEDGLFSASPTDETTSESPPFTISHDGFEPEEPLTDASIVPKPTKELYNILNSTNTITLESYNSFTVEDTKRQSSQIRVIPFTAKTAEDILD